MKGNKKRIYQILTTRISPVARESNGLCDDEYDDDDGTLRGHWQLSNKEIYS